MENTEKKSSGLSTAEQILSMLIPLIGVGIYLVTMNANPQKSKDAGQCALIGFVLGLVFIAVLKL